MPSLIETSHFSFEFLSVLAEKESWRKEVNRPIYHIHKWWAKRLGSIFRGIILGAVLEESESLEKAFFEDRVFPEIRILDPFMGSGTTVGEAHKLGCRVYGQDINPVAVESVRVALDSLDRSQLFTAFEELKCSTAPKIKALYQDTDANGFPIDILYFFWVKYLPCPTCNKRIDLFSSRIFAKNAYVKKKPEVRVICPTCDHVFNSVYHKEYDTCPSCHTEFLLHEGPVKRSEVTCNHCQHSFQLFKVVKGMEKPLPERMYAKLILNANGEKVYMPVTKEDIEQYQVCSDLLAEEIETGRIKIPSTYLSTGYNTQQAINYHYHNWRDFFNARQLLALGWLQDGIASLSNPKARDALLVLFSGILEFNNRFTSFKGEGTGAVRHMFSHHILKPERTPLEANVWGTSKSSGSFQGLFKSRLLRALEYREKPFEIGPNGKGKWFSSRPMKPHSVSLDWKSSEGDKTVFLACGSSDTLSLPEESIDFVITDPPFFDNVHYSELADFFYAWQMLYPRGVIDEQHTTRHEQEVQDTKSDRFASKLAAVFAESTRVLRAEGLLIFTYHHSRQEGWESVYTAVRKAGLSIVNALPVKAELSLAAPKAQAKEPIQLDIILVCKKEGAEIRHRNHEYRFSDMLIQAEKTARDYISRLESIDLKLSLNDKRIIQLSQILIHVGKMPVDEGLKYLKTAQTRELTLF